jgi:hypothetical protein
MMKADDKIVTEMMSKEQMHLKMMQTVSKRISSCRASEKLQVGHSSVIA